MEPSRVGALKKHWVMEGDRNSKPPSNVTAFWCSLAKGSHDLQLHSRSFFFFILLWDFFPFPKRMKATKNTKGEVGRLQQHKADEK